MKATPLETERTGSYGHENNEVRQLCRLEGSRAVVFSIVLASAFWLLVYLVWRAAS